MTETKVQIPKVFHRHLSTVLEPGISKLLHRRFFHVPHDVTNFQNVQTEDCVLLNEISDKGQLGDAK
jgi:hypothetical protein